MVNSKSRSASFDEYDAGRPDVLFGSKEFGKRRKFYLIDKNKVLEQHDF